MKPYANLIINNIGNLVTPKPYPAPIKGKALDEIIEYNHAYIAIKDDKILDFGEGNGMHLKTDETVVYDACGKLASPGLVDSHTHVVHYGSREYEFEKKNRGVKYLDILKEGGGILSSVKMTKDASYDDLYAQSKKSLNIMLKHGTTTVEGKSGYGLFKDAELKQLRVSKQLNADLAIDIVPTYLGAHAIPKGYSAKRSEFIDHVIETLDTIKAEGLAEFVDVFCETGVFSVKESEQILSAAKSMGFGLKIHSDEIQPLGGTELAVNLKASSADHLMVITDKGIQALANSETIGNILPATSFNLRSDYAPVRKMIDHNVAIAISSDYNPGSSPSENFLFTLNIAAIHLKLSPNEILNAATLNPAHSLNRGLEVGAIAPNYKADIVLYDAPNWPYVLYHFAVNHVSDVFKSGKLVVKNQQILRRP